MRATGYVREAPRDAGRAGAGYPVERLRQRVRDAIDRSVADRRAAGVLAALAVGDQGAIEREDWDLFRNTGVAHLVSISGVHVTMFAWLAGPRSAQRGGAARAPCAGVPAPLAARWGGLSGGAGVRVLLRLGRAVAAHGVDARGGDLLQAVGVRWPWLLVLLAAAVVVTALDPWALDAGRLLAVVHGRRAADGVVAGKRERTRRRAAVAGWRGWPARLLAHLRADLRTQVDRHARPDAAHAGLLPAGLGRRLPGQPGRDPARHARHHAARAARHLAWRRCGRWAAWSVQALESAWLQWLAHAGRVWRCGVAPPWAQLAGLRRRGAAGDAGAVAAAAARVAARAAAAAAAARPARRRAVRPASPSTSARARPCSSARATTSWSSTPGRSTARQRRRPARAAAVAARPRRRHIDRLGAQPSRQRPRRRRARVARRRSPVGELTSSLEPGHPLLALARAARCAAGQRWTWDGVDFAVLRPRATTTRGAEVERDVVRAARVGRRPQRAAHRRHRARAGGALVAAARRRCAATCWSRRTTAAAPRRARRSSTRCAAGRRVPGRLPQPLRPPGARGARALSGARHRRSSPARPAAPGNGAPAAPPTALCERDVARRYWQHRAGRRAALTRRRPVMAWTLLPSLPGGMRWQSASTRCGARTARCASTTAATTAGSPQQPPQRDALAARGSRGDLPPRRHHLRRLRREGRRRRRRHRAADPVRPDPARHPGARVARDGARPAPARDGAEPLHPRRLPRARRSSRPASCRPSRSSATPSTAPR